jgi:two-component system cell cycle sensor histidine kinase/response regulator CckA
LSTSQAHSPEPDPDAPRLFDGNFREVVEHLPLVTWISEPDEGASNVYTSPQIEALLGYTPAEWRAGPDLFWRSLHPDDLARLRTTVTTDESTTDDFRLIARDGRTVWCRGARVIVRDEDGRPRYAQGYLLDISEQKAAEEERLRLAASHRLLLDSTGEAIFGSDTEGRCTFVNRAALELLGYEEHELLGQRSHDVIHHSHPDGTPRPAADCPIFAIAGGAPSGRLENEVFWHKDGTPIQVECSALQIVEHGEVHGAVVVMTDLTARNEAEDVLERSNQRFRALIETAPGGILTAGPGGAIVLANAPAELLFGYEPGALIGVPIESLFPDCTCTPGVEGRETPARRMDGTEFPADVTFGAIQTEDETHVSCFVRDVGVHVRLERSVRQSQKLRAVGQLAGGIAHDFNNIMVVIKGYSAFLEESLHGTEAGEDAAEISRAAKRAVGLTRQLLAFSREQVLEPQLLDLNEVVDDLHELLARLVGRDVEFATTSDAGPLPIEADAGNLELLLVNLVENARDAMPDGGALAIATGIVSAGAEHPVLGRLSGRYGQLVVSDTGAGIDAATLPRIFEPFFTTKQDLSTGLGLATVYGIVEQSGGKIDVESVPGEGSVFTVYLPIAEGHEVPRADEPAAKRAEPARPETILLVDDERPVRDLVSRYLRAEGYHVLEAAGPREALALALGCGIDLLVTDIAMPEMSGGNLAESLRKTRPGLSVVYMSGYSDGTGGEQVVLRGLDRRLQKPFEAAEVGTCVRGILDRSFPEGKAA